MQHIATAAQAQAASLTVSPSSTGQSPQRSERLQRLKDGAAAAKAILSRYPDYGKAPPEYLAGFSEALACLDKADLEFLAHPLHGLSTRCRFLPTIADAHALLAERRAKAEQFRPVYSALHKVKPDAPDAPWNRETDFARKRRVVREYLGYDPDDGRQPPPPRELVPPSDEEVRSLRRQTPPAPVTPQLVRLLARQGWPVIPGATGEAESA